MNTHTVTAALRRINFNMKLQDTVKLHKFEDIGMNTNCVGFATLV